MNNPHAMNLAIASAVKHAAMTIVFLLFAAAAGSLDAADAPVRPPNIIIVLADDMGYGDPGCNNAHSKCHTPNIDRIAEQGMRFTDAHSAGSTCVPSRYGLLTGRYPLRCPSLNPSKGPIIEKGRTTIATLLRDRGYATAMIGKWHLGFENGDQFDYLGSCLTQVAPFVV